MDTTPQIEIVNDEMWSCMVVLLKESSSQFEEDIDHFRLYSGNRFAIEVLTPRDIEPVIRELTSKEKQSKPSGENGKASQDAKKRKSTIGDKKNKTAVSIKQNRKITISVSKRKSKTSDGVNDNKNSKTENEEIGNDEIDDINGEAEDEDEDETGDTNVELDEQLSATEADTLDPILKIALAIKTIILRARVVDLTANGDFIESVADDASATNKKSASSRKSSGKRDSLRRSGSSKSSRGSGNKKSEVQAVKTKFTHDEPECGPNKYFILVGFPNTSLIAKLINVNVPLLGIIRYGDQHGKLPNYTDIETVNAHTAKHNINENKNTKEYKVQQFWLELFQFMELAPNLMELNDFAIISCTRPTELESTIDKDVELTVIAKRKLIYDYLSEILYEIGKNLRRYIHYMSSNNLIECPLVEKVEIDDFDNYKRMMNSVPLECVTVEYVLHSIIEQVIINLNNIGIYNLQRVIGNDRKAKRYICEPQIINNKNKIRQDTFNVEPDISQISANFYSFMPYSNLVKNLANIPSLYTAKMRFQIGYLHRCLEVRGVDEDKFQLLLHQILFTQLYERIRKTDIDISLEQLNDKCDFSIQTEMMTDQIPTIGGDELEEDKDEEKPAVGIGDNNAGNLYCREETSEVAEARSNRQYQLFKLKSFINFEEIKNFEHFSVENNKFLQYSYVEEMNRNELLQSLQRARNKCTNMYYLANISTNSLLAFFNNDYNKDGIFSDSIEGTLHTPIGFRDYFMFVRHDIKQWLLTQSRIIEKVDRAWKKDVIKNRKKLAISDPYPHPKISAKWCYKNKFKHKMFDICNYYVNTREKQTTFFTNEGVVLKVKHINWTASYSYISFILNSSGNTITYHHVLEDRQNLLYKYPNKHFNVTTNNGTIITCIQKLIEKQTSEAEQSVKYKKTKRSSKNIADENPQLNKNVVYDYDICLPTGLRIEIRHDRDYIKQYYLDGRYIPKDVQNEEFRNYTRNGTVIIFYKTGFINILYPNGSRIEAQRIYKSIIEINETPVDYVGRKITRKISKKDGKRSVNKNDENMVIYRMLDGEVFCWTGEYFQISCDMISKYSYQHKMRLARDDKQVIMNKADGTTIQFTDSSTMNVKYADDTLISSEIGCIFATSGIVDENGEVETNNYQQEIINETDKRENFLRNYYKTFKFHILPAYKKLNRKISDIEMVKAKHYYLDVLLELNLTKDDQQYGDIPRTADWWCAYDDEEIPVSLVSETGESVEKIAEDSSATATTTSDQYENMNMVYRVQHPWYASVSYVENENNWIVEMADGSTIIAGQLISFIITNGTIITLRTKEVNIHSSRSENVYETTTSTINFNSNNKLTATDDVWVSSDSLGRTMAVNAEGNIRYFENSQHVEDNSLLATFSPTRPKQFNRFFVIRTDLTGYEFIHESDNEKTIKKYTTKGEIKKKDINDLKDLHLSHSYAIFQDKTDCYKIEILNPFADNTITTEYFSDYLTTPKKWIHDIPSILYKERSPTLERPKRPLAIIYRNVKDISINYKKMFTKLLQAIAKIDAVKSYLYDTYESNTRFSTSNISRDYIQTQYEPIFPYVGSLECNDELERGKPTRYRDSQLQ